MDIPLSALSKLLRAIPSNSNLRTLAELAEKERDTIQAKYHELDETQKDTEKHLLDARNEIHALKEANDGLKRELAQLKTPDAQPEAPPSSKEIELLGAADDHKGQLQFFQPCQGRFPCVGYQDGNDYKYFGGTDSEAANIYLAAITSLENRGWVTCEAGRIYKLTQSGREQVTI